jgi:hypothetical protein
MVKIEHTVTTSCIQAMTIEDSAIRIPVPLGCISPMVERHYASPLRLTEPMIWVMFTPTMMFRTTSISCPQYVLSGVAEKYSILLEGICEEGGRCSSPKLKCRLLNWLHVYCCGAIKPKVWQMHFRRLEMKSWLLCINAFFRMMLPN